MEKAKQAELAMTFRQEGFSLIKKQHNPQASLATQDRRFRSFFGTTWHICAILWNHLTHTLVADHKYVKPIHLLWALLFLKLYKTKAIHATIAGTDERTFRKWVWIVLEYISYLEVDVVSKKNY